MAVVAQSTGFYLDQLLTNKSGVITLLIPSLDPSIGNAYELQGILTSDPTISLKNKWGSALPDVENLATASQLLGSQNIVSWLAASQAAWKGTDPLTVAVEFYLISYRKKDDIKFRLKQLMKLATVWETDQGATVKIHAGYYSNFTDSNKDVFNNEIEASGNLFGGTGSGLVTMKIGDQITLSNLLLEDINSTFSTVQCAQGAPLFIKVNAQFRGNKAALTNDIDLM